MQVRLSQRVVLLATVDETVLLPHVLVVVQHHHEPVPEDADQRRHAQHQQHHPPDARYAGDDEADRDADAGQDVDDGGEDDPGQDHAAVTLIHAVHQQSVEEDLEDAREELEHNLRDLTGRQIGVLLCHNSCAGDFRDETQTSQHQHGDADGTRTVTQVVEAAAAAVEAANHLD